MKINALLIPLSSVIAAMLIAGCGGRHTPPLTHLNQPAVASAPSQPQDFNTTPVNPPDTTPVTSNPVPVPNPVDANGHIRTADIDLADYTQDTNALAAYTVHFQFDSAVVQDSEQANIASVVQALGDQQLKLLINGHCDERGTEEYNRSLGERRALALREALQKLNVDPMRVKTVSYGKDRPVDPGHDEAAWAKNRRGEFVLLHPKNPAP
jgi:peptidoglycan-associated lipoprotein